MGTPGLENPVQAGIVPKLLLNFSWKFKAVPPPSQLRFPSGSPGIFPADAGPMSVTIPASPFMQKLGFGTGVSVYLMKRLGIVIAGNPGEGGKGAPGKDFDPGFYPHGYGAKGGIWDLQSQEGARCFGITLSWLEFQDLGSIPVNPGIWGPLFWDKPFLAGIPGFGLHSWESRDLGSLILG